MRLRLRDSKEKLMSTPRNSNMRESKSLPMMTLVNRRYLIMEDQYKQLNSEYNEKKEKIKEMIPSEEDFHMQEVQRRHYLHMLANEKVRLNDTVGRNNHLKVEINIMRKEIL